MHEERRLLVGGEVCYLLRQRKRKNRWSLGVLQCNWSTAPFAQGGRKDVLECGWDGKGGLSCLVGVEIGIGKGGLDGCLECQLLLFECYLSAGIVARETLALAQHDMRYTIA